MKKHILKIALFSLLAVAVAAPTTSFAQEKKEKPAQEKKEKKAGQLPFRGKVTAVDKTAMTVTVGERVFHVTSETRVFKAEKPATLEGVTVGEIVRGSYTKGEGDKLNAKSIYVGQRPEGEAKKKKKE